jgi:hypothetical protein
MALSRFWDGVLRLHRIHEKFSDTSNCRFAVRFFHQIDVWEILLSHYCGVPVAKSENKSGKFLALRQIFHVESVSRCHDLIAIRP